MLNIGIITVVCLFNLLGVILGAILGFLVAWYYKSANKDDESITEPFKRLKYPRKVDKLPDQVISPTQRQQAERLIEGLESPLDK